MFEYRLPRLCLALLVGFGMGMSGVVMQDLLHNNLASPGTLGVSAGSGLFVTVYVAFVKSQSSNAILLPVLALAGGLVSAGIIFLLGSKRGQQMNPTRLIMTGVAVSSAYGAVSTALMLLLDQSLLLDNGGQLYAPGADIQLRQAAAIGVRDSGNFLFAV